MCANMLAMITASSKTRLWICRFSVAVSLHLDLLKDTGKFSTRRKKNSRIRPNYNIKLQQAVSRVAAPIQIICLALQTCADSKLYLHHVQHRCTVGLYCCVTTQLGSTYTDLWTWSNRLTYTFTAHRREQACFLIPPRCSVDFFFFFYNKLALCWIQHIHTSWNRTAQHSADTVDIWTLLV